MRALFLPQLVLPDMFADWGVQAADEPFLTFLLEEEEDALHDEPLPFASSSSEDKTAAEEDAPVHQPQLLAGSLDLAVADESPASVIGHTTHPVVAAANWTGKLSPRAESAGPRESPEPSEPLAHYERRRASARGGISAFDALSARSSRSPSSTP